MASMGTLSVDLVAKTGGFDKSMKQAAKRTETFDRKMRRFSRNMNRHFSDISQSIKRLSLVFVGLGASIGAIVSKFSGMAENLDDVAQQTGTTAAQVQVLHRAATVAGTSVEALDNSLARYTKRVGKAAQDTGPSVKALKDLGLSARDLVKKDITEQLKTLFNRLNALEDPARRAADMDRIFGDSWRDLIPLMQAGEQGLQAAKNRIEELGGTITRDGINKTAQMTREFRSLASDIQTVLMKAIVELSPQIKDLADYFSDIITNAAKTGKIETFFKSIKRV